MLSWLKDLIRPVQQQDPKFGRLRYLRDARFWEGKVEFQPIGGKVEVLIPAEARGPSDQQRAFFDELVRRYDSLWPDVRVQLGAEARKQGGADVSGFELVAIDLPSDRDAEWALSYESRPPSTHFRVILRAWRPREVVAER
jgi:hypothetical protein